MWSCWQPPVHKEGRWMDFTIWMDFFSVKRKPTEKKTKRAKSWRDPGSLWHCLRLCIQPWLKHTHGLFRCMRKDKTFLFKSVGLIFCHLNKKVHNQYNILPMDHQRVPHAKGPSFKTFKSYPSMNRHWHWGEQDGCWSVGGYSTAGLLCWAKELMGFWLPEHLCWNSLGNFAL